MSHTDAPADHPTTTAGTIAWVDKQRHAAFDAWLSTIAMPHGLAPDSLSLASADASFRRYLRIDSTNGTRIIMDAPPDKEDCQPFVQVAELMAQAGLRVPLVLACRRLTGRSHRPIWVFIWTRWMPWSVGRRPRRPECCPRTTRPCCSANWICFPIGICNSIGESRQTPR